MENSFTLLPNSPSPYPLPRGERVNIFELKEIPSPLRDCVVMGKTPSFPRKRESRSLKLLRSINDWMPALHHIRYRARICGHDEL
jgi:hypothetical protein